MSSFVIEPISIHMKTFPYAWKIILIINSHEYYFGCFLSVWFDISRRVMTGTWTFINFYRMYESKTTKLEYCIVYITDIKKKMKLQVTSSKSVVLLHIILLKICFEVIIINIYVTCPSNFEYKKPARLQLNWSLFITFVVLNNYLPKITIL